MFARLVGGSHGRQSPLNEGSQSCYVRSGLLESGTKFSVASDWVSSTYIKSWQGCSMHYCATLGKQHPACSILGFI